MNRDAVGSTHGSKRDTGASTESARTREAGHNVQYEKVEKMEG
jgi:hypothetical protein